MSPDLEDAQSFRIKMKVTRVFECKDLSVFPICPRCEITLEREFQSYCDRCGQHLDWSYFGNDGVLKKKYANNNSCKENTQQIKTSPDFTIITNLGSKSRRKKGGDKIDAN